MGAHEAKQMILEQEQMLQAEASPKGPELMETVWILFELVGLPCSISL